jgi:Swiss Army Knife RNA repair-like protein
MSRNDGHLKMPANRPKPLLLVDVDGVISLFGFGPDERPAGAFLTVDGILHYLSAAAGDHLRQLSAPYELVWCSGWEERANEYLPQALGLPGPLHHLTFAGAPGRDDRHWKIDAIEAYAGPDRPLAWIDDDHNEGCEEWARERPGPTLLLTTEPPTGITDRHIAELEQWARALATSD